MSANVPYTLIKFNGKLFEYKFDLKRVREDRGYTQSELAVMCCVSKNCISDIERGNSNPSLELIIKLCSVLRVCLYEILDIVDLNGDNAIQRHFII